MCYKTSRVPPARPRASRTKVVTIFLLQQFSAEQITEIGLLITFLVMSLGLHEAAHAWVAWKCGDSTARDLGRITLNPIPHIDPVMTLILPTILYFATNGMIFGGAKPVPVNGYNLRRPLRDMAFVAFAGPLTNFLLACLFWLAYRVVVEQLGLWPNGSVGSRVLAQATFFNLLLAAFNMIPIPPLDGSRILAWLLPTSLREGYRRLEGIGMILIFFLIFRVPAFQGFLQDTIRALMQAVDYGVSLGGLW